MVENVTKRRRVRSLALLGVLLGLCIAAAVVWLLYYHNRTYLSDAVANVDGTIETGSNAVELALKGLRVPRLISFRALRVKPPAWVLCSWV